MVTTNLSSSYLNGLNVRVNEGGSVVWVGKPATITDDLEIFSYSGGVTVQVTDNSGEDNEPRINAAGDIFRKSST